MTNEELLANIKAEIERLEKENCINSGEYFCMGRALCLGRLRQIISENQREQMESEKPSEGLEEEINRLWESFADEMEGPHNLFDVYARLARHFYDLGCTRTAEKYDEIEYNRQRAEEECLASIGKTSSGSSEIPNDLEEAADNHIRRVVDAAGHPGWDWTTQDIADAFIAGAKWQADHTPLPEDTVLFNKGVEEGKRLAEEEQADLLTIVALDAAQRAKDQMMKEAVEVVVWDAGVDFAPHPVISVEDFNVKDGDKVRIIIVKED